MGAPKKKISPTDNRESKETSNLSKLEINRLKELIQDKLKTKDYVKKAALILNDWINKK